MSNQGMPPGRRERAKQDKRDRIMIAAREMLAVHGVHGVTTQQIADKADVAIGTLYLYASTKAELLIMVQNQKFAAAIADGLAAAADKSASSDRDAVSLVTALIRPVVICVREHPENGRAYLHELIFGDPTEPYRSEGLTLATRLETGISSILERNTSISASTATLLARVITAIVHISTTATVFLHHSNAVLLADIREQITAILGADRNPGNAAMRTPDPAPLSTSL